MTTTSPNSTKPTRRRWFRFSLRTMLVLVTLVSVYLGWAMNWVRQRREFREQSHFDIPPNPQAAPWSLRWLGEEGVGLLFVPSDMPANEVDRTRGLFPEAEIQLAGELSLLIPFTRRNADGTVEKYWDRADGIQSRQPGK